MADEDPEVAEHERREGDRLLGIAQSYAAQLSEHFETVQIVCTKTTPEGTMITMAGEGNWYARKESAREFLKEPR